MSLKISLAMSINITMLNLNKEVKKIETEMEILKTGQQNFQGGATLMELL